MVSAKSTNATAGLAPVEALTDKLERAAAVLFLPFPRASAAEGGGRTRKQGDPWRHASSRSVSARRGQAPIVAIETPQLQAALAMAAIPMAITGCGKFKSRFGRDALKYTYWTKHLQFRGINAKVVRAGKLRMGDLARKVS